MPSSPADSTAAAVGDLVMPKLGLTMTEGLLAEWRVGPGDAVRAGDVLFVVETDKIANEIEAPGDGEIVEIVVDAGQTVAVGAPLARWTGVGTTGAGDRVAEAPAQAEQAAAPAPRSAPSAGGVRILATPLARRIARERGVELAGLAGSGPGGRIKAADVEAARDLPTAAPAARGQRIEPGAKHMAMVRRVVSATRDIPQFHITRRAEVSGLQALRDAVNASGGPRATLNHFVVKAIGRALIQVPEANRIWDEDGLLELPSPDVGFVVDTADGLFIPVLRDVAGMPFDRLCREAAALAARARSGGLSRDDMEGGAVSVSNLGMAGVDGVAPIISPPQSAILGVGAASGVFRPDDRGAPVLRREMTLTLVCDHRVFDGMGAARFLDAIVRGLEAPHALLLTEHP